MRLIVLLSAVALLTACVGTPPRQGEIARYDLGDLSGQWQARNIPIAAVNVRATSWLDTPEQTYRLAYADSLRRRTYTESRWAAPPAELFERFLRRRIVFGQPDSSGPGCRLNLMLDELDQRFDSPQTSQMVLEVRANLLPWRGEAPLAKRAFLIRKPAPTPDAKGGVAATREAMQTLADELAQWLNELARSRPALCQGRE